METGVTNSLIAYIENGEDLNAKYKDYTLLNKAITLNMIDQALLLIDNGADLNTPTNGTMPLVFAAKTGNLKLVRSLVENGANLKKANEEDFVIYQIAAQYGHAELANYLRTAYSAAN
jgi:ankyrin repeat protein